MNKEEFVIGMLMLCIFVAFCVYCNVKNHYEEMIEELKHKYDGRIARLEAEKEGLNIDLNSAHAKIDFLVNKKKEMPHDCNEGPWCETCSFHRELYISHPFRGRTVTYCDKANVCKGYERSAKCDDRQRSDA